MKLKELKEIIQKDFYRYYGRNTKQLLFYGFFGKSLFRVVFMFRLSCYFSKKRTPLRIIISIIRNLQSRNYKISIPREAKIGPGFCIFHAENIRINESCTIGSNFTIGHLVTIGWINRGPKRGVPEIGNNVFIGPGALVIGKIKIGDNVLISGNSFVNIDIPSNSFVYGNPCIIKHNDQATEGYILNAI